MMYYNLLLWHSPRETEENTRKPCHDKQCLGLPYVTLCGYVLWYLD